ncbi:MAG TPA: hypothetical protein VGF76_19500 [Polyangiaceae bacterium]
MKGLFYSDSGQLVASVIGVVVDVVWVGLAAYVGLKVVNMLVGNRVSEESEIEGLDEGEMGLPGYAAEAGHPVPPEMAGMAHGSAPSPAE